MEISGLNCLVTRLEADSTLTRPSRLRSRIQLLDELDAYGADACAGILIADTVEASIYERARALQRRLEALNSAVFETIRDQIRRGVDLRRSLYPRPFWPWMRRYGYERCATVPGLGYDDLDELISGVLDLREPDRAAMHPGTEMVFYQPTPVRHILDLIEASALCETDVLIDLGSGLGHVPMLTSVLTGCRSVGIEVEIAYCKSALDCAARLELKHVRFLQQDVRETDLSNGSVFYMYTPFKGKLLEQALGRLRRESAMRAIKVCTLGPCVFAVAKEPWLEPATSPDADRITCFRSR